jgi:nicotinate-nucleotide pyrophosphorylase (carboxylating)
MRSARRLRAKQIRSLEAKQKNGHTPRMTAFSLPGFDLDGFVRAALDEDLGVGLPGGGHDVTAESVIPADKRFSGVMDSRDAIVVAGLPIAAAFFRALDPEMEIKVLAEEGESVPAGTDLMRLSGNARAMLTAERSALNTVQHLSGIATMTRQYVEAMGKTGCVLLDTRKTIPGLRILEKYATRMGGAQNHRMGLWDAAMIKDNHILVAGNVGEAVRRARDAGVEHVICEVDRLDQIEPALGAGANHLLLDNMSAETLRDAVAIVAGRVPTEASGGIDLETIGAKAATGVTYVSVGRLTQSAPAADIGLDFTPL